MCEGGGKQVDVYAVWHRISNVEGSSKHFLGGKCQCSEFAEGVILYMLQNLPIAAVGAINILQAPQKNGDRAGTQTGVVTRKVAQTECIPENAPW